MNTKWRSCTDVCKTIPSSHTVFNCALYIFFPPFPALPPSQQQHHNLQYCNIALGCACEFKIRPVAVNSMRSNNTSVQWLDSNICGRGAVKNWKIEMALSSFFLINFINKNIFLLFKLHYGVYDMRQNPKALNLLL